MKNINFAANLVPLILSGEKTSTWRLFDDKNLSVGDEITLTEFGKDEPFATAEIMGVKILTFGELTEEDKSGHEKYSNDEEMYKTYSGYYKTTVGPDTELKIIHFKLR